jgi:hypothetical protein
MLKNKLLVRCKKMSYSEILSSLCARRGIIIVSIALAVIFGTIAALYPIPYVAKLSLLNHERYFTLAELKVIKNKLPIVSQDFIESEQDQRLRELLTKTVLEPKWVDKNITPVFSFTKSDSKELVDLNKGAFDPLDISWLNIQATSIDDRYALQLAQWIAREICVIGFKEKLRNFAIQIKAEAEKSLLASSQLLPDLYKQAHRVEGNIKIVSDVHNKYQATDMQNNSMQLNFNISEYGKDSNKSAITLEYLPISKQLSILETQLLQIGNDIKLAEADLKIYEKIRDFATKELKLLEVTPSSQIVQGEGNLFSFSQKLSFDELFSDNSPEWLKNYFVSMKNNLHVSEVINSSHYELEISQLNNVFVEEKYSQIIVILSAMVMGLLLPVLGVWVPEILRQIK